MCPGETADRLEGKKTPTSAQQQADGLEDGERLVVSSARLTTHSSARQRKHARLRDCVSASTPAHPFHGQDQDLEACSQALMVEIREEEDES